jgi:stage II sporulation protein D
MFLRNMSFLIGLVLTPSLVLGSETIRVAIAENQRTVLVSSRSGLRIEGQALGTDVTSMTFGTASVGKRPLRVRSVGEVVQANGKGYRGWLELRKKSNGLLLVINELDIEDYLQGVVAAEIPHEWEFEALKAQAIASRTYALYQKRSAGSRPYHILATVNSQVYSGSSAEHPRTLRAVRDTRGIVITYQGEIIPAFYHSSCGGHTEDASELWGIDEPYLNGVDCECQEISAYGLWEKRVPLTQVARVLRKIGYRVSDDINDLGIGSITPAGRVKDVAIRYRGGKAMVGGEDLRTALGTSLIPSVFFELELSEGEAVFSGRGRGHGVGLCQWGSEEMALRGYDYRSILSHYYPGTTLTRMK